MFRLQALSSRRFQLGFHRFNLHRPTATAAAAAHPADARAALHNERIHRARHALSERERGGLGVAEAVQGRGVRGVHSWRHALQPGAYTRPLLSST